MNNRTYPYWVFSILYLARGSAVNNAGHRELTICYKGSIIDMCVKSIDSPCKKRIITRIPLLLVWKWGPYFMMKYMSKGALYRALKLF